MKRSLTVLDPGPLTTVQDRGRPGWAHLGVPRSGALDRPAASLANRLVGNPDSAAVLETTLGGVTVRTSTAMTLAVTGAECPVTVDGRPAPLGEPLALGSGQTLLVGPATRGLRSYVAAAGGVQVAEVLGSRSTDTLSGMGPEPVSAGAVLPVGDPLHDPHGVDVSVVRRPPDPVTLRVVPGPRTDWFIDEAMTTLTGSTYTCSADSNRVGLRLHGPRLVRERSEELPSEGLVLGAVQVPASGEPLVFLNDHPTTGGYPVIGVVRPEDLAVCAQLRPGDRVRFAAARGAG
ncbi:MAG TPA: biotin-dependent carboxyltransferase family protein [Nocardioidaceae bacterium]|nr:biotin-dependent carboxyltransferase family protein [Nocardioidaceae bacterium]